MLDLLVESEMARNEHIGAKLIPLGPETPRRNLHRESTEPTARNEDFGMRPLVFIGKVSLQSLQEGGIARVSLIFTLLAPIANEGPQRTPDFILLLIALSLSRQGRWRAPSSVAVRMVNWCSECVGVRAVVVPMSGMIM